MIGRGSRWRAGFGALLVAVALTACGDDEGGVGIVNSTGDGVFFAFHEGSRADGGDGALVTGTVVDAGGCLVLEGRDGDRFVPVFPYDTQVAGGLQAGDVVSLGGGFSEGGSSAVPDLPPQCPRSGRFFFVNESVVVAQGVVLSVEGGVVTIEVDAADPLSRSCSQVSFGTSGLAARDVVVGDVVQVHHDGAVRESHPCQVTAVAWTVEPSGT